MHSHLSEPEAGCFIRSLEEEFPRDMSFGIFPLKRLSRMRKPSHSLDRGRLNAAWVTIVKERIVIFAGVQRIRSWRLSKPSKDKDF
jgi:hypothetical protein